MVRRAFVALAAAALSFAGFAGDENPYKNAKVGDWVEYKSTSEATGFKMDSKMKQTVKEKSDKEITISIEMDMGGNKNTQEQKIDLTKEYNPAANSAQPGAKAPKVEKLGEGDEAITVGGKEYKTHWVESKSSVAMGPTTLESTVKVWSSKDVPLSGLVKMTTNVSTGVKTSMELTGSSAGK